MLIPSALMQSMASFVAQNVGAGNSKRARQSMLTGIGIGLAAPVSTAVGIVLNVLFFIYFQRKLAKASAQRT